MLDDDKQSINQPVTRKLDRRDVWLRKVQANGMDRVRVVIPIDPESVAAIQRHAAHLRAKHRAAKATKP